MKNTELLKALSDTLEEEFKKLNYAIQELSDQVFDLKDELNRKDEFKVIDGSKRL